MRDGRDACCPSESRGTVGSRELLKTYLLVGGMPAAVETYVRTLSLSEVRAVQTDILSDYARDFAKHATKRDVPRITAIWESLPRQLAKEGNRTFTEFKGALTEQYVQQELRAALEVEPFTWAPSDSSAEIDFLWFCRIRSQRDHK